MMVCSHWRTVILSAPSLWRRIDMNASVHHLSIALQRSAAAHLIITGRFPEESEAAVKRRLSLLQPEVAHLQSLEIRGRYTASLATILRSPLPHIETLIWHNGVKTPIPQLSLGACPTLRRLTLDGVRFTSVSEPVTQLRLLHLFQADVHSEDLLRILVLCPALNELSLARIGCTDNVPSFPRTPSINLPNLSFLHIQSVHPVLVDRIFGVVGAASLQRLHVFDSHVGVSTLLPLISSGYLPLLSRFAERISFTDIVLSLEQNKHKITFGGSQGTEKPLRLDVNWYGLATEVAPVIQAVNELLGASWRKLPVHLSVRSASVNWDDNVLSAIGECANVHSLRLFNAFNWTQLLAGLNRQVDGAQVLWPNLASVIFPWDGTAEASAISRNASERLQAMRGGQVEVEEGRLGRFIWIGDGGARNS